MRLFKQFLTRREEGVAAIEFAILSPFVLALMAAILEIGYFVYATSSLQTAAERAIDDIRTGHVYKLLVENDQGAEEWIKERVCDYVSIAGCDEHIVVQVQSFSAEFDKYSDSDDDTTDVTAGTSGTLMRVEVRVPIEGIAWSQFIFGDEEMTLKAGLTFMTEPY